MEEIQKIDWSKYMESLKLIFKRIFEKFCVCDVKIEFINSRGLQVGKSLSRQLSPGASVL